MRGMGRSALYWRHRLLRVDDDYNEVRVSAERAFAHGNLRKVYHVVNNRHLVESRTNTGDEHAREPRLRTSVDRRLLLQTLAAGPLLPRARARAPGLHVSGEARRSGHLHSLALPPFRLPTEKPLRARTAS